MGQAVCRSYPQAGPRKEPRHASTASQGHCTGLPAKVVGIGVGWIDEGSGSCSIAWRRGGSCDDIAGACARHC